MLHFHCMSAHGEHNTKGLQQTNVCDRQQYRDMGTKRNDVLK